MRIVEPESQVFATAAATPSDPPRQNPNDGVSKLTIDLGQVEAAVDLGHGCLLMARYDNSRIIDMQRPVP